MAVKRSAKLQESTYAERLQYARWVRGLTAVEAEESDTELWTRAGVKQSWFSKWKDAADAPPGHRELVPLARALGVEWEWLAGQSGYEPPLPALWRDWLAARHGRPADAASDRYAITGEFAPVELPYVDAMEDAERREAEEQAAVKVERLRKRR